MPTAPQMIPASAWPGLVASPRRALLAGDQAEDHGEDAQDDRHRPAGRRRQPRRCRSPARPCPCRSSAGAPWAASRSRGRRSRADGASRSPPWDGVARPGRVGRVGGIGRIAVRGWSGAVGRYGRRGNRLAGRGGLGVGSPAGRAARRGCPAGRRPRCRRERRRGWPRADGAGAAGRLGLPLFQTGWSRSPGRPRAGGAQGSISAPESAAASEAGLAGGLSSGTRAGVPVAAPSGFAACTGMFSGDCGGCAASDMRGVPSFVRSVMLRPEISGRPGHLWNPRPPHPTCPAPPLAGTHGRLAVGPSYDDPSHRSADHPRPADPRTVRGAVPRGGTLDRAPDCRSRRP